MEEEGVQEIFVNEFGVVWLWRGGVWIKVDVFELMFEYLKMVGCNLFLFLKKFFNWYNILFLGYMLIMGEWIEMMYLLICFENMYYLNICCYMVMVFVYEQFVEWEYYKDICYEFVFFVFDDQCEWLKVVLINEECELWELVQVCDWFLFMCKVVEYKQNIVVFGVIGSGKIFYIWFLVEFVLYLEWFIIVEDMLEMLLLNYFNNNCFFYKKLEDGEGVIVKDVLYFVMCKILDCVFMVELWGDEVMFYLFGVFVFGYLGGMMMMYVNLFKDVFFCFVMFIK